MSRFTNAATNASPKPRVSVVLSVMAAVGLLIAAASIGFVLVSFRNDVLQERQALRDRHVEATAAIDRVYDFRRRNGSWPGHDEFDSSIRQGLSSEWSYWADGDEAVLSTPTT